MSVVAYKNGVLVADSMVSTDGTFEYFTQIEKLHKTENFGWFGAVGDAHEIQTFFDWLDSEAHDPPKLSEELIVLQVDLAGEIILWCGTEKKLRSTEPFVAIGSGAAYAIGAMEAGYSARQAVELACKYTPGCGGRISEMQLPLIPISGAKTVDNTKSLR